MSAVEKALPVELTMSKKALVDGVSAFPVRAVPSNVQSVASQTLTLSETFTNGTVATMTMPAQQINIDIPIPAETTWIDTQKTTLSFRAKYVRSDSATIGSAVKANLRGNAFNFIQRISHTSSSGTIIDDVVNCDIAHQNDINLDFNASDLDSLALAYGFDAERVIAAGASDGSANICYNTGHDISFNAAGTYYHSYCFPLPSSVIGRFCSQFWPIGKSGSKLTVSLVLNPIAPITIQSTATPSGTSLSSSFSVELSDFAINMNYVDLGVQGSQLLGGAGPVVVAARTHRVSSAIIPASTTGSTQLLIGLRGSSVRSLYTRFSENAITLAGSANGVYDSKAPLGLLNYFLGGSSRLPAQPYNVLTAPATVFMAAMQASNAFSEKHYKHSGTPNTFCLYTAGTLPAASDQQLVLAGSTSDAKYLGSFVFGYHLAKLSKEAIMSGYNMNSSNNYLELNLTAANTNSLTAWFIGEMDVLYIVDGNDVAVRI